MKKYTHVFTKHGIILFLMTLLSSSLIFAQPEQTGTQRKLAQTGFKFLTVSMDARAAGMGDAISALEGTSTALFYNPSSMAWMEQKFSVGLARTQWIADIEYNAASAAFSTPVGVFGISALMVNYGEFIETITADNDKGFRDIGTYSPTGSAYGLGYARALTNQFAVGAQVKYVTQNLDKATVELDNAGDPLRKAYSKNVVAVDFGVIYNTGFRSLKLAMNARNFSQEVTYAEENFELPLVFRIGLSMDLVDLVPLNENVHSLLFSIDTERPRDYYEQAKIGLEYTLLDMFSFRAGYIAPTDVQGMNFGVGIKSIAGFNVDYSYSDYGVFDGVNRFSINFAF